MSPNTQIQDRKLQHIEIVAGQDVEPVPSIFEKYRLPYRALPEIDFADVNTEVNFEGFKLSFPFFISSMTGGEKRAEKLNRHLAEACQEMCVGLGLGSMRVILEKPEAVASFDVKKYAPSIPVFANMGVVQLNYGYGASEINKIIDSIGADGIFLHINPLQEVVQPEGDKNWVKLVDKIAQVLPDIEKPVIFKEVGNGIDVDSAKLLQQAGANWLDVNGVGGTSWSWVEGYRRQDNLGFIFRDFGVYTDVAIKSIHSELPKLKLMAGGGLRNGLDLAKSLALGASLGTAAKPFLEPALESTDAVISELRQWQEQFQIALFATGTRSVEQFKNEVEFAID